MNKYTKEHIRHLLDAGLDGNRLGPAIKNDLLQVGVILQVTGQGCVCMIAAQPHERWVEVMHTNHVADLTNWLVLGGTPSPYAVTAHPRSGEIAFNLQSSFRLELRQMGYMALAASRVFGWDLVSAETRVLVMATPVGKQPEWLRKF